MSRKKDYDEEPVFYCERCLSLSIKQIPFSENQYYCSECGATNIESAVIEEWEAMYRKKHGHDFVEKKERKWPYWCQDYNLMFDIKVYRVMEEKSKAIKKTDQILGDYRRVAYHLLSWLG